MVIKSTLGRGSTNPRGASTKAAPTSIELSAIKAALRGERSFDETMRLAKAYADGFAANPPKRKRGERSAWDKIEERARRIPQEELDRHPPDGARNLKHYLYGSPKQDPD